MLTPKWLSGCADRIVALYAEAESSILDDMARRISTYDFYIPAAQYQEKKLAMMGMTRQQIVRELSRRTGQTEQEIEDIIAAGTKETIGRDGAVYKQAGKTVPKTMSAEMKSIFRSGLKQTGNTFLNLTRTTANTATKQFENALDLAWMQVSTGAMDASSATRRAIKNLCRAGIQSVAYPTGHTDSLETAVARAIRTGVNQTALKSQEQLAAELGMDLVEVTAHAGARPSHAEWQGQVYSLTGNTRGYEKLSDATGYGTGEGLGGWNCRHSFFPWSPEMGHTYSRKELEEYERPDAVEYNGRKMSLYEAEQMQRGMERNIRRWKREQSAMKAAGLDTAEASGKVKLWNSRYKDFCGKTGLKTQSDRLSIESFKMSGGTTRRTEKALEKYKEFHYHKNGTVVVTDDWKGKGKVSIPKEYKPFAVVETKTEYRNGTLQIDRTVYDENGRMKTQIHSGSHNRPDQHKLGKNGEHAHEYTWNNDGSPQTRTVRELTSSEQREHADILGGEFK